MGEPLTMVSLPRTGKVAPAKCLCPDLPCKIGCSLMPKGQACPGPQGIAQRGNWVRLAGRERGSLCRPGCHYGTGPKPRSLS